MSKFKAFALIVAASAFATIAHAETLQMGDTGNAARFEQAGKPTRGMSQASVEAEYGPPQSNQSAVGDPPIARWEYANFVVFFEYDRVIHAVTKR
ncbi:MAG: hypothetical protein GXP15_17485 [Gammaproteobacteria bacterium]|nr:hypothetical protein [Gammaproteobacteria bacterium]